MRIATMITVLIGISTSSFAETKSDTVGAIRERGAQVATQACAACHAIGKTGTSANPKAPVFRTILAKQPAGAIAEDLREGLSIGHKTMPRIQLPPDDVDALIAYLLSIQETEI